MPNSNQKPDEKDKPEVTPSEGQNDNPSKDEKAKAPKTPEVDMAEIEKNIEAKVAERVKVILDKAEAQADGIVKNAEKAAEGIALKMKPKTMSSDDRKMYRNIGLKTMDKLKKEKKVKIFIPYSEALKEKEVPFSINNARWVVPTGREVLVPESIGEMWIQKQKADGAVQNSHLNLNKRKDVMEKILT